MALSNLDRELLKGCLDGSDEAWRNFCKRFGGLIAHCAAHTASSFQITLDDDARDDLISDVFVGLLDKDCAVLRRFRGDSSLAAYLVVVARRIVVKRLTRRELRRLDTGVKLRSFKDFVTSDNPPGHVIAWDSLETFQGLSEQEALAIRMFHLEGKSYREISSQLGLEENSVGPFLSRAREKLRRRA